MQTNLNPLTALSPLDGRYRLQLKVVADHFSEFALIRQRVKVECLYLLFLAENKVTPNPTTAEKQKITTIIENFDLDQAAELKKLEQKTKHDVKAVEYFLRQRLPKHLHPYIHLGLTSEDTNNLAYRLMAKGALEEVVLPQLRQLLQTLVQQIEATKSIVMLARTHGQPAIPTTFGKELAVFANRIANQYQKLMNFKFQGKLSGAVGGYQSFAIIDPKRDWQRLSQQFTKDLNLLPINISTQINPEDDMAELFTIFSHLNSILIGFSQDIWRYISDGWVRQKGKDQDVGSSTMPQKINPIEFENSEGNLQLANAILAEFGRTFPISRLQRDLSGSTVKRSIGVAIGHSLLAYQNLTQAISKLEPDQKKMIEATEENWNILSEALQIRARINGDEQAYEKIAEKSKNQVWTKAIWQELAQKIAPELIDLTPNNYLGLSVKLAEQAVTKIKILLSAI